MKWIVLAFSLTAASLAQAAEKKEYKKHFENPVADERIEFSGCAVSGALYGILTGETGDVLCWGRLKNDGSKTEYFVFKGKDRKTQDYFVQISEKNLGGFDEGDMGAFGSAVKLRTVTPSLEKPSRPRQSTLKFETQWMSSEGTTWLKGKLPGGKTMIDAPVFNLSTLDEELDQFRRELDN